MGAVAMPLSVLFGPEALEYRLQDSETVIVLVDPASLPPDVEVTHVNLYDRTVEGLRHRSRPVFSVQYHPEASPGPHDADYLFDDFIALIDEHAT